MVLGVLNQAFDVLVLRYGVQKRIYCNVSAPLAPPPDTGCIRLALCPHLPAPFLLPGSPSHFSIASSGQELRPRTLLSLSSLEDPSYGDDNALRLSLRCGPCWDTVAESVEPQTLLASPPSTRPTQEALPRHQTAPAWEG